MKVRYTYLAFLVAFSIYFVSSITHAAIDTAGIDVVSDKDVLEPRDFEVIDNFVSDCVNELVKTTDFASIAKIRSTFLRYSVSNKASAREQYSSQFMESAYRHLGQAFTEADLIEPVKHRERVLVNLLILVDRLGDLPLTEYVIQQLKSENTVIRYWALHCVCNASIVEQMNTTGADSLLLAREVARSLKGQIESAKAEELALMLQFVGGINLKDGKDMLLDIADVRISRYANWKVDYELLEATLLHMLNDELSNADAEKQKAFGRRFGLLFSYVIQRYIKGQDILNEMQKRRLVSVMVDVEMNCVSNLLGRPQVTIKQTIEGNSLIGLLQEHNRLLGDETSAGELPRRLNFDYGNNDDGSNRTYPPELPDPRIN